MIFGKAKTTANKNSSTRLRISALFVARILSCVALTGKKRPALNKFSETGRYAAFSNNQEMAPILHKKLDGRVEKLNHLKLEVIQPKIKNEKKKNESRLPAGK